MKIISIIPARMGSSRFPGKPLAKINGIPMIQHVYRNVKKNKLMSEVVVATCDKIIFDFVRSINGNAIMTSKKHERASERCCEALRVIEKRKNIKYDIVVMVQGDEPMINSAMIDESIQPFSNNKKVNVVNLMSSIDNQKDFDDPNFIKIVHDKNNNALYFSRANIPHVKFRRGIKIKKQVCLIPFRRDFLIKYNKMKPTSLEKIESIDMLRILENGYKVFLVQTKHFSHAVDTKNDLFKVAKYMRK